jgi:hypothetical protein
MKWMVLAIVLAACTAPRDSASRFGERKYKVREHARDGQPSVRQTWWKRHWFWEQPLDEKRRTP